MSLVNPNTGRTFDHDNLLACIEDWTRQKPIVETMVKQGVADITGIMNLVSAVRLALEGKDGGLSEVQAAASLIQMIANDRVRAKIARRVASLYQLEEWQAERDLIGMAEEVAEKIPGEEHLGH